MEGRSNSKELFRALVSQVTLPETIDEIESIILLLLEKKCGLTRADIIAGKATNCSDLHLANVIDRINSHEPIQYILGVADFFGREFHVNPSVLIPRPETELLVEEALKVIRRTPNSKVLDIGTGSGCIAVTLALETSCNVTAIDVSEKALDTAGKNASSLGAKVNLILYDFLGQQALRGSWDLIVSNPPYVRRSESSQMKPNVMEYEPHTALFVPDEDALVFYKAIAEYGKRALTKGGTIVVELNEYLGNETELMFSMAGYKTELIVDINNKDRILRAYVV
jgi:release factor glutamine methyltransferase